jgi:hypothetical protein
VKTVFSAHLLDKNRLKHFRIRLNSVMKALLIQNAKFGLISRIASLQKNGQIE